MLTREQVFQGYQLLLGRLPENEDAVVLHQGHATLADFLHCVMGCQEFINRPPYDPAVSSDALPGPLVLEHLRPGAAYQVPTQLRTAKGDYRALLIGQCMFDLWPSLLQSSTPGSCIERVLVNNLCLLPGGPQHSWEHYDFQLIQVPLRSILPESEYLKLRYDDVSGHQRVFSECVARMKILLQNAASWSDHIPAFIMNYFTPQQNMLGRLLPRYDMRNPIYFIEELNKELSRFISERPNRFLLDTNQVAGVLGRRFIQEDSLCSYNHGGLINNFDQLYDTGRLIEAGSVWDHYDIDTRNFIEAVWAEAAAMFETLRGRQVVKMVCVDLDDTLWRGVLAERDGLDAYLTEGWPLGVLEALAYLKKRGVILCIVSKNDEAFIREKWSAIFGPRFSLDDFAILKINWKPKAENIAEAIAAANILPSAVLFLDDNPVERAAVKAVLPDVRIVDAPHYEWKRILLWSAETQVATINFESSRRTELIQAQVQREGARASLSHTDFLAGLNLNVTLRQIHDTTGDRFQRAFELLNKTNQFNTTGEWWTHQMADVYLGSQGSWWCFEVADRFTQYGLVGVAAIRSGRIDQFAMSCRVVGLGVETAVLATLCAHLDKGSGLRGRIVETAANRLSRDLYERSGWRRDGADWMNVAGAQPPLHVSINWG
jgi:FkbH-like protein